MARAFLLAAVLLLGPAAAAVQKVTPVEKVLQLMGKLTAEIEAEGKEEAAAYDKYACFCKEQADNKIYAKEKSVALIAEYTAELEKLDGELTKLDEEIKDLGTLIDGLTTDIAGNVTARETEHNTYLDDTKDIDSCISAVKRAIAALDEAKKNMKGKVTKEALLQVRASLAQARGIKDTTLATLSSLINEVQPGESANYEYRSNDIIALLEDLLKTFQARKATLDQDEFDNNAAFETKHLAMSNDKKFAEKDKLELETIANEKDAREAEVKGLKDEEEKAKAADAKFMEMLTKDCEKKAEHFDQRSKTREGELTALAEATETLKSGVAPNYAANKKLVLVQGRKSARAAAKGHWVFVADKPAAPTVASFLQLRGSRQLRGGSSSAEKMEDVRRKLEMVLMDASEHLRSPALSAIALKVRNAENPDHFLKVRQLIHDLIHQLNEQAKAEETTKGICDEGMADATSQRDEQQALVELNTAKLDQTSALRKQLKDEILVLTQEIADNEKAKAEATELRTKEKAENEKTIAEAHAGYEAVSSALQVLESFYNDAANNFLQLAKYTPPNADRDGKSMADLAPDAANENYKGKQEESNAIIGLLEVIKSDFERTEITVTADEADAQSDYDDLKEDLDESSKNKQNDIDTKTGEVGECDDDMVAFTQNIKDANKSLAIALAKLEELHAICVAGEETYEERVAKRKKEIEALKEAHAILENWQG